MTVHRKSNWYIYLLAFATTLALVVLVIFAFRWYLFPEKTEHTGLNNAGGLSDDFTPTPEHSFNLMMMLSDGIAQNPQLFTLVTFNAVESRMTFIPLPNGISLDEEGKSLVNLYADGGGNAVTEFVEKLTGVRCDAYVRLDKRTFVQLVSVIGNANFVVPKTLVINDEVEGVEVLNAGSRIFTADVMFKYVFLAEFEDGESYRFNTVFDLVSTLINQNYYSMDGSLLDTYFSIMSDAPDTNLTQQFYTAHKAALLYTIAVASFPAEYYVPYGTYDDDGSFTLRETSLITIRQQAGLE